MFKVIKAGGRRHCHVCHAVIEKGTALLQFKHDAARVSKNCCARCVAKINKGVQLGTV